MTTFTASDVLLKAASRIEEEGMWCRRHWYDDTHLGENEAVRLLQQPSLGQMALLVGRYKWRIPECAQGAMASSIVDLLGYFDSELLDEANDRVWSLLEMSPVGFNDRAGSAHEVADAMRKAAL